MLVNRGVSATREASFKGMLHYQGVHVLVLGAHSQVNKRLMVVLETIKHVNSETWRDDLWDVGPRTGEYFLLFIGLECCIHGVRHPIPSLIERENHPSEITSK